MIFNEKIKEDIQNIVLKAYNCYNQESDKLHWESEYEECINILIIRVKNSGKTFLVNR